MFLDGCQLLLFLRQPRIIFLHQGDVGFRHCYRLVTDIVNSDGSCSSPCLYQSSHVTMFRKFSALLLCSSAQL